MRNIFLLLFFSISSACGQGGKQAKLPDTAHAQVEALNRAGAAQYKKHSKQKALRYHNRALQQSKRKGLYEDQIRSLMSIAHVLKNDDADQGILHLKRALSLADSIGHQQLSAEIYRSLSEIYRQQANYKQALDALEEHHRLADKIIQANKDQKIALLEKTYQRNGFVLLAIAISIILLILFYYFRKKQQLNTELHKANQIKDKLFTIIGHDLRNPIGSINSVLALMEHDELTADEQRQMIGQMRRQGDISLEILNSLLSWGQAQLKGISIKPVVFAATVIVEKNITALQGKSTDKRLTVLNHVSPDIKINADVDHFDFIIRNLLSNAIKFSHQQGTIEISASASTVNNQIFFAVKDEGVGISAAQQKAFQAEYLDITFGTGGEKGTGIGLMLSKEFLKASGGSLWLESVEGKGTTFYFAYPAGVS